MESKRTYQTEEQEKYKDELRLEILDSVVKDRMPKLPYHNYEHAKSVEEAVSRYSDIINRSYEDKFLLRTAAKIHDIIFVKGRKDNEEKSAEFAEVYLPLILYTPLKIQTIKSLVLATKMPQNPNNYLEQLLCDADLDNLGRLDFFELGEKVRIELGIPDNEKWYEQQLKFLTNHQYHTDVARTLRDSGKEANVKKLEKMIQEAKC